MKKKIFQKIPLYITILLLLILQFFCARLAYRTIGEITSSLYFAVLVLNSIPLVIFIFMRKGLEFLLSLILLTSLIIIPYQLFLGYRLILLGQEAGSITGYIYAQRLENDAYPDDLSGYDFEFPELEDHFTYQKENEDEFYMSYHVSTPSTSHYYHSVNGKWGYYPD